MLGAGYAAVRAPWPLVFGAALRFVFATARTLRPPTIVCATGCPTSDSAEASAVACTATGPVSARVVCPTDDSAEASDMACTGTGPASARNECPASDSAEASDVADVTAGSGAYPGARPAGEGSTSLPEPAPARPPSGLRQAVDAEKRAFNRADALLAVVQAYLRGDRPNRARST
jgi:hypothetical protein